LIQQSLNVLLELTPQKNMLVKQKLKIVVVAVAAAVVTVLLLLLE